MTTMVQPSLDDVVAMLRALKPAIAAEGVTRLAIFGSRARGDARPDSDLDILVDIDPKASFSLLNLAGVQHIVEDGTGIPAQATMTTGISKKFAARIADDLVEVF